ncbi:MAG TPA: DUF1902 domain-containing protein [Terriglobales bacterium]|nr:DUF1902 domain-containing protein [Terriglobales bacterium]
MIRVRAFWDSEAAAWVAESEDVPGLATEAPGLDALKIKLDFMVPELLLANGLAVRASEPIQLLAEFPERLRPVSA